MVKKKKNRHQQEPASQNGGDSTESCDENLAGSAGGKCCAHVIKAVDLGRVKKALKPVGLARECAECSKSTDKDSEEVEVGSGLWLCLRCGHQACGRTCRQHALKHFNTPRSDTHALAVHTELWNVWCYECDTEVSPACRKKLHECIKYLKQQDMVSSPKTNLPNRTEEDEEELLESPSKPLADVTNTTTASSPKKKVAILFNLPRVRGLRNLGNTCFFNSVLQCLAQTPFLLDVLQEMSEPGTKFTLPGGINTVVPDSEELPLLEGELGKWGGLTESLATTLHDLKASNAEVLSPQKLLNKLSQRYPQFADGDQHDSHELLRHLLEEVRSEDLKRYWSVILHRFGLSQRSDPTKVEDELRTKARVYGRQASELILHPEQVFRGLLVSTLECQDCLHSSQRVETFLELSLPVTANKPQPPVLRRKSSNDEAFDMCGNPSGEQPSKHQQKKDRKQARKGRKKQKGGRISEGAEDAPAIVEEKNNTDESEHSDADVEDNLEQDVGLKERGKDVGESGYSSEKAANEDSAIESPVSLAMNGDSALASPDFTAEMRQCPSHNLEPMSQNGETPMAVSSLVASTCNHFRKSDVDSLVASTFQCKESHLGSPNLPAFSQCNNIDASPITHTHNTCMTLAILPDPKPFEPSALNASSRELSLSIPSSSLPNPPNRESALGSPASQVSNRETPSPVSSELNMDCVSPASTRVQGDCTSPASLDLERPFSRFNFYPDDYSAARCSPADAMFNSSERLAGCSINPIALPWKGEEYGGALVEGVAALCLPKGEEQGEAKGGLNASWSSGAGTCGRGDGRQWQEVDAAVSMLTNGDGDKSVTMSPRYQCEEGECSVQSCLNQFTVLELMTGNNKVVCENCTERINQGKEGKMVCTNSTKQYLVSSPPAVLILHLKRFQVHRTMFRKISRHVSFPLVLDIAPICATKCKELPTMSSSQTQVLYSLYGVVEHSGTLHAGHYVAYIKVRAPVKVNDPRWSFLPISQRQRVEETHAAAGGCAEPPPGKWYYVSDSRVNEVGEDRVLRSQAYLLFYERIW